MRAPTPISTSSPNVTRDRNPARRATRRHRLASSWASRRSCCLVAMANVGTLLVARGVERRQEMALRAGLDTTRRRLVRQLVTESVLLALAGGVCGGIVAVWAADLVVAYFATAIGLELLRPDYLVDWRVFGFIATTAMTPGVLTGLASALRSTRIELARAIGSGGRNAGETVSGRRLTNGLVVLQVAVSMLLLVCAGLFVHSGRKAGAIDFGFRTDDLLVLSVDPLAQGYDREQARGSTGTSWKMSSPCPVSNRRVGPAGPRCRRARTGATCSPWTAARHRSPTPCESPSTT